MLISDFDPYEVLQSHEKTIGELIAAHNEVAKLNENLAESVVILNRRIEKLERFVMSNINET
tara:strand:+ start:48 stop:233 length:186 start_codon:yes stop_codon:yes gene_type:complete